MTNFQVKIGLNWFFVVLFDSKKETYSGLMFKEWHKIIKPPEPIQEKIKLTARDREKNEHDSTKQRRLSTDTFYFPAEAFSLIFSPNLLWTTLQFLATFTLETLGYLI